MLFLTFTTLQAQTAVDRLVHQLDSLTTFPVAGWKYSTDFGDELEIIKKVGAPGYEDFGWETLDFNQRLYVDSCWLLCKITLPEKFLGAAPAGKINLVLAVDDFGFLWVNGEEKGYFPWDGTFQLSEDARGGMEFVFLVKAVNTGGPLRLLQAEIEFVRHQSLVGKARDISLSLRVGQKLLSSDTYQSNARVRVDPGTDQSKINQKEKVDLNRVLQEVAASIKLDGLIRGDSDHFYESLGEVTPRLRKIDQFAKRYRLVFTANAHIDAAWLWRKVETQQVCKNTFSSVLRMMDQNSEFTYTQSSAAFYKWMEELYPDLFRQIKDAESQGRWEIIGGTWIEPDCNLIGGESWYRQLLYGQNYFKKRFGKTVKIGWNPDSFGYNWNMPQFYRNAGIDAFITQKIGWNDTSVFPHRLFWWEAPNGSRIFSYFPFDYVNQVDDPYLLVDWLRQFEANTGFTRMMVLFGVGDHGGGPTPEMLQRIEDLRHLTVYPKIEYQTSQQYLDWLRSQDLKDVPVWQDELYLEYHRGTFTTQAVMKKSNRKLETELITLEKLATIAGLYQFPYPETDLRDAWEKVLFNQFHDILPGSSIREVYVDANEDYREAKEIVDFYVPRILGTLAREINTSVCTRGKPVVVFNSLSTERNGEVILDLETGDDREYALFNLDGREIPTQLMSKDRFHHRLLFQVEKVPAVGYQVYELRSVPPSSAGTDLVIHENFLENSFFRVEMNDTTGWITRIFDKKNQREILAGPGNELQLYKDIPRAWDAWNIGLSDRYHTKFRKMEIVEQGPVRVILRVYHDFLNPATVKNYPTPDFPTTFFEQDIILYRNTPRIDFCTRVDWWEDHTMLKVAFPVTIRSDQATYEIPYATISRPTHLLKETDKGKWEVPALRWADISQTDYGVTLLNKSKYGYDIKGNTMRLSLLRSPTWPDPTADRGQHFIEYAIYPHAGNWQEARLVTQGYSYNTPLIAVIAEKNSGKLPAEKSFFQIEPDHIMITGLKKAEGEAGVWIIQMIETKGTDTPAVLHLPVQPGRVYQSNFLEENIDPVRFKNRTVPLEFKKNETKTVKIYLY